MDIMRDLERIECKVTQYASSGEAVMPLSAVLTRVGVDLPRALRVFQTPADVSGRSTYYYTVTVYSA